MKICSSILHWSQFKRYNLKISAKFYWNWGDNLLKVHCFHCCNLLATNLSSIKVYNCLTNSECSSLFEINLLIPEWFLSLWSDESRVLSSFQKQSDELEFSENCFLRWTGFVWQELRKFLPEFPSRYTPRKYMHACSIFPGDNHLWRQHDECKASSQRFQD